MSDTSPPALSANPRLIIGTTRAERTAARETAHQEQAQRSFERHLLAGGREAEEAEASLLRGQPVFYWSPVIDQFKREGRLNEALELAIECADHAGRALGYGPVWGWVKKVAIIARKMRRYDFEVEVLERFLATTWHPEYQDEARARVAKAQDLLDRSDTTKNGPGTTSGE